MSEESTTSNEVVDTPLSTETPSPDKPVSMGDKIAAALDKHIQLDTTVDTEDKPGKNPNRKPQGDELAASKERGETEDGDSTDIDEGAEEEQAEQEKPERKRVAPPKHFTKEQKALFEEAPEGLKEFIKSREKELGGAANNLNSQLVQTKQKLEQYEQYQDVLKQADEDVRVLNVLLKQQGVNHEVSVKDHFDSLIKLHRGLMKDPVAAIEHLAKINNVDLKELVTGDRDLAYDKMQSQYAQKMAEMQATIDALKAQSQQANQQVTQQQQAQQLAQIQSQLSPYYEGVPQEYHQQIDVMAGARFDVLQAQNPSASPQELIKQSIEDAIYAIPELREQRQQALAEASRKAKQQRLQESKQMSFSPSATTAKAQGRPRRGLGDALSANLDKFYYGQ